MLKGYLDRYLKRRVDKKILTLLEQEKVSMVLSGVVMALERFDIKRLTESYDAVKGDDLKLVTTRGPIELLTDVSVYRECLVERGYLPADFSGGSATTKSFDSWYSYQDCGIVTERWFPTLRTEVTKLAKVVEGAELVALEEYSYYARWGKTLVNELAGLARALVALGAD